jgi:hypothetical protein
MIKTLALFGDSVTIGLGISGFNNPISSGGQGSWSELLREGLANINGFGPLISSGVIAVWNFGAPSGAMWSRSGSFTAVVTGNAYDKQPDGRGATGSHATDIWTFTKPPLYRVPIGFQLYFVDLAGGGGMQYRLDGGTWTNFGQTLLGDNKLMTFKVASGFSNTLDVRHFNGTSDVLGCLHGIELVYSNATDGFILQNHAVNGSALHSAFTSTAGDRMAIIDSVKAGTGSPTLPHPNIGVVAMYVNDIARASVTDWAADLSLLYTRASPLGPVAFMSPYEVTPGTYLLAQQVSYRAQTKTSATSLGAKGPLDFYDAWSSNGWVGNAAEIAAGLLDDGTHPSQLGNFDMYPRVYWFVRNNLLSVGNTPSIYTALASQASASYTGAGKAKSLLSTDSFNRANVTGSVGSTDGAGTLDPQTWTLQQGTSSINSNTYIMGAPATVGPINGAISTLELGIPDVDLSITIPTIGNAAGIVFRFSNTSNYWYYVGDGTIAAKIRKNVAGVVTNMGSTHGTAVAGDVLRVVCTGSSLSFYLNGVFQETIVDSHNSTATKHGLLVTSTGGPVHMDNWSASAVSVTAAYSAAIPVSV